jgi:hypothetical protein
MHHELDLAPAKELTRSLVHHLRPLGRAPRAVSL